MAEIWANGGDTMTSESDPHLLKSKKVWVPLENNPEVMTRLARKLGLSDAIDFHEPYSLTDPDLKALIPRPVHALIFLYPEHGLETINDADTVYDGSGADEPVMWFRQTLGNVCGFMALTHCVLNSEASTHIIPDSFFDKLQKDAIALKPIPRAQLLYESPELEQLYKEAAQEGDSRAPGAEEPVDFAFTGFVKGKDSHLYQLEGWKKGPIDRGVLAEDEDLFSSRALELGPLQIINSAKASEGRFSCVVLTDADA